MCCRTFHFKNTKDTVEAKRRLLEKKRKCIFDIYSDAFTVFEDPELINIKV